MTIPQSRLRKLQEFLSDAFRPQYLEMFLVQNGYRSVSDMARRDSGAALYYFDVAQELHRQGLVDQRLFATLAEAFPGKKSLIEALAAELLSEKAEDDAQRLLSQLHVEELIGSADAAGLLDYDTQMTLLGGTDPMLVNEVPRAQSKAQLFRDVLDLMNRRSSGGTQPALARWLTLAVEKADKRGHGNAYRRALEVLSGAEYRAGDDLDDDSIAKIGAPQLGPFLRIDFLSKGLAAAASICRIKVYVHRDGERESFGDDRPVFIVGSGWLITPSLLVTAWHLVAATQRGQKTDVSDTRLNAANLLCQFDFDLGATGGVEVKGKRLLAWSEAEDIALVRLRQETERPGLRLRDGTPPAGATRVSLIHHGHAALKLMSLRGAVYDSAAISKKVEFPSHLQAERRLLHDLPTAGGSSGAPVFDDEWAVAGQHLGYLSLPPGSEWPSRLGFATTLDAIRRFLDGVGVEADDEALFRHALEEIRAGSKQPPTGP